MPSATRLDQAERERLIAAALTARRNAYAPYSHFEVGAALLAADGAIITGANVENASYGLTTCAERVALFTAVAGGRRQFRAVAIATAGGGTPCGACRQALSEFCDELSVLLINADRADAVTELTLGELLPHQFRMAPDERG